MPGIYTLKLDEEERSALLDAANSTNLWFGPKPDPPTPIMRALVKLENAKER